MEVNHKGQTKLKTDMKKINIDWSKATTETVELKASRRENFLRHTALVGAAVAGLVFATQPAQAGSIFVIAMENHNFTQPIPTSSPQQILSNSAAPYINSLITPGNPNSIQVSYATRYFNAGKNVHPSEPNYVWAEAGSDFGVHTDADPRAANGNIFSVDHLTAQFNTAGIAWKNYQEDVQLSTSPTNSASGTTGPVNPYYGNGQYNYAVKHNPMAFFPDTAIQNVYPLSQLFLDLAAHAVGKYNWITPNQFDDAHSALSGGFTYQGVHYTGDQASIAQGDNFLSQIVPQIMATPEYQSNGVIVIWWDESENGDDTNHTIPEIVISPLAKGNAYASSVVMNHSSDIKTMEEIFGLSFLNNPIPINETNNFGGYNNVATVNDLSDLFAGGVIPAAPSFKITREAHVLNPHNHNGMDIVRITNTGSTPVSGPLYLVLDNLSSNVTLSNSDGTSSALPPLGSPYVLVNLDNNTLNPGDSAVAQLKFSDPTAVDISYSARVLPVVPTP